MFEIKRATELRLGEALLFLAFVKEQNDEMIEGIDKAKKKNKD